MVDLPVALAGLFVGFVVGLTGMGGGALMTPALVLLFGVQPLTAVSSDLVASLFMKPIGGGVHWLKGTVNWSLVRWLMAGSVPAAFGGVFLLRSIGHGESLQTGVKHALGVALIVVATALVLREIVRTRLGNEEGDLPNIKVKRLPTYLIGVFGGLVVGVTSVGSGSLMMLLLLGLYPKLRLKQLVGTDLVQAIPLVGSAALAHMLFGQVEIGLTLSILVGALPGVYLGARVSSRASDRVIRPALVVVLTASGLKLLGANSAVLLVAMVVAIAGVVSVAALSAKRERTRSAASPEPEVPPKLVVEEKA
jgi:hypothetical protein